LKIVTPVESDPIYSGAPASGITSTNITNWNTAYGWGNHASAGYLTSYTETDPVYSGDSIKLIHFSDTIYYLATKSDLPKLVAGTHNTTGGYDTCFFEEPFSEVDYVVFADGIVGNLETAEIYIQNKDTSYFSFYCDVACTMKWHVVGGASIAPPPLIVSTVVNDTTNACIFTSQSEADTDFADWLDDFAVGGGCNPSFSTNPISPSAPYYCGGEITVVWTVTDICYDDDFDYTATYVINDAPSVIVTVVDDYSISSTAFTSQSEADIDFADWLDDFAVSGGCNPSFSTNPASPSAPDYTGGETTVVWTVSDVCYDDDDTATYVIAGPPTYFPLTHTATNPVYGNTGNTSQSINGQSYYFVPYDGLYFSSPPTDFQELLYRSSVNDPDIGDWDVSNIRYMADMFSKTTTFNQDISGWDVSNVDTGYFTGMASMFYMANSFNQDLSGWCVSQFSSKPYKFDDSASSWVLPRPVWGTCP
jgi:hypothetical protein